MKSDIEFWYGRTNLRGLSTKILMFNFLSSIVIFLYMMDEKENTPRPPFLPQAVPADLVERISRLHGDPIVWWVSQFLLYMLRPQPHLTDMLQSTVTGFGIERPMVGIHIRRTDKVGTEAAFHPVEEYMKYVEEWFRHYELTHPLKTRRVYVASDDPKVLGQCRKKYPEIEFIGDQNVAKSAAVSSRYTDSSLRG